MKPRIKSMIWNIRKQKKPNHNNKKKEKSKKNEDTMSSSLWYNLKRSNLCIIGVSGREEEEHEIGNLFQKTMKENFPNLVKEINMQFQASRESQTR